MTPERIAELRQIVFYDKDRDEMLNEIERLRGLVAVHVEFDWHDDTWGGLFAMCRGCGTVDHVNDCGAAKNAHIAAILDGAA